MSDSRNRYDAVSTKMRQLLPEQWETNEAYMTNLSLLVSAIVKAKDLTQHGLAAEMPLAAQDTSLAQRQRRWLMDESLAIRTLYAAVITPLIQARTVPLIVDTTEAGSNSHLLVASMGYHQRAVPLAWSAGQGKRGHTRGAAQIDLLGYVATLLPAGTDVVVLGDGEFGHVQMLAWLTQTGWEFCLRVAHDTYVWMEDEPRRLDSFAVCPGDVVWLEQVALTQAHPFGPVNVLLLWDEQRNALLPLVTSLPTPDEARYWYRRRTWTEPLFGDLKGHGFDWQTCRLRHPDRIARLMLAVALAYLWMLSLGALVWMTGKAKWVDRTDRRDRSLFTIGRQWLNRILKPDQPIFVSFIPYPFLRHLPTSSVG